MTSGGPRTVAPAAVIAPVPRKFMAPRRSVGSLSAAMTPGPNMGSSVAGSFPLPPTAASVPPGLFGGNSAAVHLSEAGAGAGPGAPPAPLTIDTSLPQGRSRDSVARTAPSTPSSVISHMQASEAMGEVFRIFQTPSVVLADAAANAGVRQSPFPLRPDTAPRTPAIGAPSIGAPSRPMSSVRLGPTPGPDQFQDPRAALIAAPPHGLTDLADGDDIGRFTAPSPPQRATNPVSHDRRFVDIDTRAIGAELGLLTISPPLLPTSASSTLGPLNLPPPADQASSNSDPNKSAPGNRSQKGPSSTSTSSVYNSSKSSSVVDPSQGDLSLPGRLSASETPAPSSPEVARAVNAPAPLVLDTTTSQVNPAQSSPAGYDPSWMSRELTPTTPSASRSTTMSGGTGVPLGFRRHAVLDEPSFMATSQSSPTTDATPAPAGGDNTTDPRSAKTAPPHPNLG